MNYDLNSAFTHSGIFHADDVFSTALLRMVNPEIKIQRGMKVPDDFKGIVYDIGGGCFDHHQENSEIRQNGNPYAAFGLLWREFGNKFLSEEGVRQLDANFVQAMDLCDCTGSTNELSTMIGDFNGSWDEDFEMQDERFWRMVDWAQKILERKIERIESALKAKKIICEQMQNQNGKILILDSFLPWKDAVKDSEYIYIIFPSNRGGYVIQAIMQSDSQEERMLKKPFPKQWCGKTTDELVRLTGIKTFEFCHKNGFLCSVGTLEDAKKIAHLALEE